jgi:hypothetical protein
VQKVTQLSNSMRNKTRFLLPTLTPQARPLPSFPLPLVLCPEYAKDEPLSYALLMPGLSSKPAYYESGEAWYVSEGLTPTPPANLTYCIGLVGRVSTKKSHKRRIDRMGKQVAHSTTLPPRAAVGGAEEGRTKDRQPRIYRFSGASITGYS